MQHRLSTGSVLSSLLMAAFMAFAMIGCDDTSAASGDGTLAHATQAAFEPANSLDESSETDAIAQAQTLKVIFLGDSLTAGLGLPQSDAFPALLERALHEQGYDNVRCVNAGVSGDTSSGGLSRIGWLLKQKPDVVVIGLGANDGMRGQAIADIEAKLRSLVEAVQASGARPLLLGMHIPTNMGPDYTAEFQGIYTQIASDLNVPLVANFLEGVGGVREMNQADGIHPTAEGHAVLAENVRPALLDLLAPQVATTTE